MGENSLPAWVPIALIPLVGVVAGIIGLFTVPDAIGSAIVFSPFLAVQLVLLFASPYFVAQERKQLAKVESWHPSRWYYLIPIVPPLTLIYVIQRYRYVGLR
jgi:hypothetical protein